MTQEKARPGAGKIDHSIPDPRPHLDREAAARAHRNRLMSHARESARKGTEALVEAANAGLMAGALRAAEPVAEFLREAGADLISLLVDDEDTRE